MAKPTKEQKRKAKLKAKKQQAIHNQQSLTERLSVALEKLCEPVLPEYIDDSNGPDLTGRSIVWQMGVIAWNIHVTGRQELAECAFVGSKLDAEQQEIVRKEIAGLVKRKIELYPRQMTAIRDVATTLANGFPRAKARPGDTFPELPPMPASEPKKPLCAEDIATLRKTLKLTPVKFGELFGVTARKVSEWEHGKSQPTAEQHNKIKALNKENIQ
ncbi:MAG: hypothetical protein IJZ19_13705 [Lentisphaeria bacterium]|nr:hypothetical protein [Lentisphaeria bacterium]